MWVQTSISLWVHQILTTSEKDVTLHHALPAFHSAGQWVVQGWSAAPSHKETGNSCSDGGASAKAEASPSTSHLIFETQDMVLFIQNEAGALSSELLPDRSSCYCSYNTTGCKAEPPHGLQLSQPQRWDHPTCITIRTEICWTKHSGDPRKQTEAYSI